eukprot:Tamp_35388.p1 GENE.Tamp_35388~~Tamp_35388.p1  ORF type:complete len:111 (-),score=5.04 Tamp_35388:184-516(-)
MPKQSPKQGIPRPDLGPAGDGSHTWQRHGGKNLLPPLPNRLCPDHPCSIHGRQRKLFLLLLLLLTLSSVNYLPSCCLSLPCGNQNIMARVNRPCSLIASSSTVEQLALSF